MLPLFAVRRVRYAIGYFWLFVRFIRLAFPGLFLYRVVNSLPRKSNLRKLKLPQGGDANYALTSELTRSDVSKSQFDLGVALALPIRAIRSNFVMEGEMLFAYKNSLLQLGITPLIIDPYPVTGDIYEHRKNIIRELVDKRVQILVLQGDSRLKDSPIFDLEFVQQIRKKEIRIVVDLIDCFLTRNGQETVNFFNSVADCLIYHNSRLNLQGPLSKSSVLWPSLPYPEDYYISRHTTRVIDVLIPGSQHRNRDWFANYATKHNLQLTNSLFSRTELTSASYEYSNYVNQLCRSKMVFTNGYRNRRESQVIGRVTETILAKAVLLYETGSDIDFFFEPYVDYIPIDSFPDFVEKSRYLLNQPQITQTISNQALSKLSSKYSSGLFWNSIDGILS